MKGFITIISVILKKYGVITDVRDKKFNVMHIAAVAFMALLFSIIVYMGARLVDLSTQIINKENCIEIK